MSDESMAQTYERSEVGTPSGPEAFLQRNGAVIVDGVALVMTREAYADSIGYRDGKPHGVNARFDQGEWWRTKVGEWIRIADMDDTYRYNTAAMLMRHAYRLCFAYAWGFSGEVAGHDGGEMAHDSLEQISDELFIAANRDPQGWLRGTKLYRALTADLPTKPKKLAKLAQRARHWSTCPKRQNLKAKICTCPRSVCMDSSCGCSGEAHA